MNRLLSLPEFGVYSDPNGLNKEPSDVGCGNTPHCIVITLCVNFTHFLLVAAHIKDIINFGGEKKRKKRGKKNQEETLGQNESMSQFVS